MLMLTLVARHRSLVESGLKKKAMMTRSRGISTYRKTDRRTVWFDQATDNKIGGFFSGHGKMHILLRSDLTTTAFVQTWRAGGVGYRITWRVERPRKVRRRASSTKTNVSTHVRSSFLNVCSSCPRKSATETKLFCLRPKMSERLIQTKPRAKNWNQTTSAHLLHGGRTQRVESSLAPLQHADGVETRGHVLLHQAQPLPVRRDPKSAKTSRLMLRLGGRCAHRRNAQNSSLGIGIKGRHELFRSACFGRPNHDGRGKGECALCLKAATTSPTETLSQEKSNMALRHKSRLTGELPKAFGLKPTQKRALCTHETPGHAS